MNLWNNEFRPFIIFFYLCLETATVTDTLAGVWMSGRVSVLTKNTSGFKFKRL